jgi:hypothetical protein
LAFEPTFAALTAAPGQPGTSDQAATLSQLRAVSDAVRETTVALPLVGAAPLADGQVVIERVGAVQRLSLSTASHDRLPVRPEPAATTPAPTPANRPAASPAQVLVQFRREDIVRHVLRRNHVARPQLDGAAPTLRRAGAGGPTVSSGSSRGRPSRSMTKYRTPSSTPRKPAAVEPGGWAEPDR